MTLEADLRSSLRRKRRPDSLKLRSIRCLVNDFQIKPEIVGRAVNMSSETVRMVAAAEGPYKALADLGPERTRWLAEWMRDYVDEHGAQAAMSDIVRSALSNVPHLVRQKTPTEKDIAA